MALDEQREYRWMKVNTRRLCRADVYFPQLDTDGTVIKKKINLKIAQ